MERPLPDVDEAVHLVRDGLGGGAVASQYLPGVCYAGIPRSDDGLPAGGLQDAAQLRDQPDVLYRGQDADPPREVSQDLLRALQANVGAGLDVEDVRVVAHAGDAGVPVVDDGVGPSAVVEEVAGPVAGAADDEHGCARVPRDVIRNLRGPDLQALGKLDRDGGVAPVADPFGNFLQFEIEHREFT